MPSPGNPSSSIQYINHPPGLTPESNVCNQPLSAMPDQFVHLQWPTYQQLSSSCNDAVLLARHGHITHANQVAYNLLAAEDNEQIIGKSLQDVLQLNSSFDTLHYIQSNDAIEHTYLPMQHQLHRKDGQLITVEMRITAYNTDEDADAMVILHDPATASHVTTIPNDTAQLRCAEDQIYQHELEFKTLVENSPDIISRIDHNMRHLYVNPAIERAFGFSTASYMGKTKRELGFSSEIVQAWEAAVMAAFNTNTEQRLDHELNKDGKIYYFSTRLIPEHTNGGLANSLLEITYDVTERTRIERERDELLLSERTARIQAETAARARDEFLAIVSHELRAPLNGIQSWAHVLENYVKDMASTPLAQRALLGIKTGVAQQVRLIEDLLDVTRMMSGKLRLVKQPIALLPVIQAAVESVHDIASAKHQSITATYKITTEQIEGDADRIQQIIWNLLSNAVKFTPENGSIWISVSHTKSEACIVVRDNGIGISAEFLPHLFDRFSQEDTSSTRGHSGLGLGLFLVNYLIERHDGRIEVTSEGENKGATFSVYIPLRAPLDKYVPTTTSADISDTHVLLPSLDGLTILLIDDQEEVRESLSIVLSSADAEVYAAASTKEAIAWLSTLAKGDLPDVLICDIAMPGEDGYSALKKIRAWQTTDGRSPLNRLPAIALTAFSQREDRIRAFTAGFNMHVTKPAVAEELIIVIDSLAAKK
jgi:PAS domain S-box-containing protein